MEPLIERTERKDPLLGATLGSYVVKHWIGEGGMGVVYLAEQPDIGKAVAIKVLKPDVASDPDHLKRLVDEARTVNAIRHRGIIDIFGFGTTQHGRQYIVMEHLEGEPLDAYLARRGRLTPAEVVFILDEVMAALAAAHKAGVVHRDLKPGNLFFAMQSDGTRYLKILDFGLAKKALAPYGTAAQTQYRPIGTPEYMAPEQARGEPVGPRTDLYAIGVIAFELLTGELPFNAPSMVELMMKHLQEPAPRVATVDASVPPALDWLVSELLAKLPDARPSSAEVVRGRLKAIARELAEAGTQIHAKLPETDVVARHVDTPAVIVSDSALLIPMPAAVAAAPPATVEVSTARVAATARNLPRLGAVPAWVKGAVAVGVLGAAGAVVLVVRGSTPAPVAKVAEPAPQAPRPAVVKAPEPPREPSRPAPVPPPAPEVAAPVEPVRLFEPPRRSPPPPASRPVHANKPPPVAPRPAPVPVEQGPSREELARRLEVVFKKIVDARSAGRELNPVVGAEMKSVQGQAARAVTAEERKELLGALDRIERDLPR